MNDKDNIGLPEQLINFLEKHKGEVFSAAELTENLIAIKAVMIKKLHQLLKYHEVECEKISCRVARKIYNNPNIKRGMRVYFLD